MAFLQNLEVRLQALQVDAVRGYGALYSATYCAILNYFSKHFNIDNINEDSAKLGVALCYSWMPTVKIRPSSFLNFQAFQNALEKAKQSTVDDNSLADLIAFIGGSVVATSKFMHFLRPTDYAIWDSRVARSGYGYCSHAKFAKPDRLMQYWKDIRDPGIKWDEKFKEEFPNATTLRIRELALFHLDIAENGTHKGK